MAAKFPVEDVSSLGPFHLLPSPPDEGVSMNLTPPPYEKKDQSANISPLSWYLQ